MSDGKRPTLRAEVLSIGDELTTGQRLDTNSQWLSRELGLLGIPVAFHTTVSDDLDDGRTAFRLAAGRADLVLATGGLGPTADDLTRDVMAEVAGVSLVESAPALRDVEARFHRRGVAMPSSNRRQALFPAGATVIPNPEGTAPGIDMRLPGGGRCFALPGVPAEMRVMWRATVVPAILAMLPGAGTIRFRSIKCFGAGESAIEAMLPDLVRRGREPVVGITAHEATITLRIAAKGIDERACEAAIEPVERLIRECLGPLVYGTGEEGVEDAALAALVGAGRTLATVEAATRGRVATLLADAAARASSDAFVGGVVIPPGRSVEAPALLAERRRADTGADVALAVGEAAVPPAPGEPPTVGIALAGPDGTVTISHRLGGSSDVRLPRAAKSALDLVRLVLRGHPLPT